MASTSDPTAPGSGGGGRGGHGDEQDQQAPWPEEAGGGQQLVMPEDGYQWKVYGQKFIKNIQKIRSYFRCRDKRCAAKKKVEWSPGDPSFRIVYKGAHQHGSPLSSTGGLQGEGDGVGNRDGRGSIGPSAHVAGKKSRRRSDRMFTSFVRSRTLDDGYSWKKFGQKDIYGSKNPRSYYRCTYKPDQGCKATRQVQVSSEDPQLLDISYYGDHSCDVPAPWREQQRSSVPLAVGIKAVEGSSSITVETLESKVTYRTTTPDTQQEEMCADDSGLDEMCADDSGLDEEDMCADDSDSEERLDSHVRSLRHFSRFQRFGAS